MCEGPPTGCFCGSERRYQITHKEDVWLCVSTKDVQSPLSSSVKVGAVHPVFTCLFCHPTFSSLPDVLDPFLHGAFAVQYVAWRTLPLELHHCVDQHQQAQCEHAGDDDGDGLHRVRLVVQLNDHFRCALIGRRPGRVDGCQLAAHEVLEDGTWVAWLHSEELVVELPVLLTLVEVGET